MLFDEVSEAGLMILDYCDLPLIMGQVGFHQLNLSGRFFFEQREQDKPATDTGYKNQQ